VKGSRIGVVQGPLRCGAKKGFNARKKGRQKRGITQNGNIQFFQTAATIINNRGKNSNNR